MFLCLSLFHCLETELLWHVFFLYFNTAACKWAIISSDLHSLFLHRLPCSQPTATVGVIAFNQSISELIILTKIITSLVISKEIVYWLHKGIHYIKQRTEAAVQNIGVWKCTLCGLALDSCCCTRICKHANVKINKLTMWHSWLFSKLQSLGNLVCKSIQQSQTVKSIMCLYLNFVWILESMDVIQYNTTFLVEDTFAGLCWCYSGATILPPVSEKLSFFIEGYILLQSQILTMNLFIYLFIYFVLEALGFAVCLSVYLPEVSVCSICFFFYVSSNSEGWSRGWNKALLSEDTRELMLFLFGPSLDLTPNFS